MGSDHPQMLAGVKVLDISNLLAGPLISCNLADFGAEVIKVEHPRTGDPARNWGEAKNGVPLAWKSLGRNKRLLALDLNKPEGQEIARRLAAKSDIMIENYRPGKLEQWGLGFDRLSADNPGLILVRVTGWGQTGPYKDRPGFGTLAEAFSGFAHITGQPDGPPTLPPFGLADGVTSLYGTFAALMALYHRDVHGAPGQVIDLAIYEAFFAILGPQATEYDQLGIIHQRVGNRSPRGVPRNAYQTADGRWVAISANAPNIAPRLFKVMGREDMITDPRYATPKARLKNGDEVDGLVAAWIRGRTQAEVLEILEAAEVAVAPVNDIRQVIENPHCQARQTIAQVPDEDLGLVRIPNIPPRFSRTPGKIRFLGRTKIGLDTEDILAELGLSGEEIAVLRQKGIVGGPGKS